MNELLTKMIAAAKAKGLPGIAIWNAGALGDYCAGCLSLDGGLADSPRCWNVHRTPEDALTELADKLGVEVEHAAPAATSA